VNANDQTLRMLRWWWTFGITLADLAVRRPTGEMLWHHDLPVLRLPLPWFRAENVRRSDVYIRPARSYRWPLVFLDDVRLQVAHRIVRKYGALAIETSPAGGCHLWLRCSRELAENERKEAQRWLASRVGADPGSISGEHLGRLAGFKNWKRGGTWVNVVAAHQGKPWEPAIPLVESTPATTLPASPSPRNVDTSDSAREWGWVCGRLEAGCTPASVYRDLVEAAQPRRHHDAHRYAWHTVARARKHVTQAMVQT
jgi:hypothetical protein